jgi:hypothetical protein
MPARFKDFDAAEAERKGEPITFRLGGREWTAAHKGAANFLAFARNAAEPGLNQLTALDDFITDTLPEEEREPFHAMLRAEDIEVVTLTQVMQWIVEQMSGNPTDVVSPSPPARSKAGGPSRRFSVEKGFLSEGTQASVTG